MAKQTDILTQVLRNQMSLEARYSREPNTQRAAQPQRSLEHGARGAGGAGFF